MDGSTFLRSLSDTELEHIIDKHEHLVTEHLLKQADAYFSEKSATDLYSRFYNAVPAVKEQFH